MSRKKRNFDRDLLKSLYEQGLTLNQIAEKLNTTRTTISRYFDEYGLEKSSRGGGNNRKVIDSVSPETLQLYIDKKYTRKYISEILGCSISNTNRLLNKYGIRIDYKKSDYKDYCGKVRRLTEKVYADNFEIINPHKYPRTIHGTENGYQLDHIIGVRECFDMGISVEEAASVNNLQMIPWKENLNKRVFNNGK